jgi:O-acetyl-ADP-ribose deacetylase (regulator of RNase III)
MGTGVGGVAHDEAASLMIKELRAYAPHNLKAVVLVDVDPAMVAAWRAELARQ